MGMPGKISHKERFGKCDCGFPSKCCFNACHDADTAYLTSDECVEETGKLLRAITKDLWKDDKKQDYFRIAEMLLTDIVREK